MVVSLLSLIDLLTCHGIEREHVLIVLYNNFRHGKYTHLVALELHFWMLRLAFVRSASLGNGSAEARCI